MKDLLLWARVVVRTSNMKISRRHLADYVNKSRQKTCRTCSTLIFPRSANQIIDLWRCRCRCRRHFLKSLIFHSVDVDRLNESACRTCSTVIFPHLANHNVQSFCTFVAVVAVFFAQTRRTSFLSFFFFFFLQFTMQYIQTEILPCLSIYLPLKTTAKWSVVESSRCPRRRIAFQIVGYSSYFMLFCLYLQSAVTQTAWRSNVNTTAPSAYT